MDDNLGFNKTIKQLETLFRFAGIFIRTGVHDTAARFKYRCLYFLHSFAANYELLSSVCWCICGLRNGADFLGITYSAPCIIISILAQFKGLLLIKHENKAQDLIIILKNLEENKNRRKSEEKDEIIKSEIKFLNFVLKTHNIFYAVLVCGFSVSPLILILVNFIQTGEIVLTLPFFVEYGFDPFQKMIWTIMYLHQCWSELAVVLNICSADYFFFTCCTYIRIQFRLLEHDLQNIIPDNINVNIKYIETEDFKINFNELVKWHQHLLESANILQIIYSKSTLLNFFSSSMIICLTGFNITIVHDFADMLTFVSFLILSMVQVYFVCFFADLLMTSSMDISNGVYNSLSYAAEVKIGKNMLMVMIRSQKACKITASGYVDVDLKLFMRVLSTAWSYFALLQTMYAN